MADWVLISAGIVAGLALAGVVGFVIVRRRQEAPVELEILGEEEETTMSGEAWAPPASAAPAAPRAPARLSADADDFGVARDELHPRSFPAPKPRPTLPPLPPNDSGVATEWARRQVGPLEPGRVRGICSGCGTTISVSKKRPLRIACPVCGRTRLLS